MAWVRVVDAAEHLFSGDSGIICHDAKTVYTFGRCAIFQLL
ncbi:hypothetical protein [Bacillus atrophaeus]